jgi:cytoskeletal protein CcmA (bactofilin family)
MLRRFGGDQAKAPAEADAVRAGDPNDAVVKREGGDMEKYAERSTPAGTGELNALLGKGSEFDGKLVFEGTVRIDGTFTGEITTSDMLIVGESAKVTAEVACGTIVVHGEVNGNIKASQAIELHKPARVKGDVSTPSLMIERGVVFEGRTRMEDLETNIVRMPGSAAEAD